MNNKRKLGVREKTTRILEKEAHGSTAMSTLIKVDALIDFTLFHQAWHIMFDRQPLLHATVTGSNNDHSFNFSANFSDIEIKHLTNIPFKDIETEYSISIVKNFTETKSLWRATLITIEEENSSYIIFGCSHIISDGKSISWLLGDLLRCIIELEVGKEPQRTSYPIPEPLENIFDYTRFSPPPQPPQLSLKAAQFENSPSVQAPVSKNILHRLEPNIVDQLLQSCRAHNVTVTAAISAAMMQAFLEQDNIVDNEMIFSVALNLRPYTKPLVEERVLALYAHQVMFALNYDSDISFWETTKQILHTYRKTIYEYALDESGDPSALEALTNSILGSIEKEQCFIPYTCSNLGVVDKAFEDCGKYNVSNYFFTVKNQLLLSMVVFATTIQNTLCLDFNYCVPVISDKTAQAYAERTLTILKDNLSIQN